MSLRIRRLRLLVNTVHGDYGADMTFPDGLVLLHLHNTRGKSTALKSIIYALGLERMFGQVDQAPLTPAMTTRLKDGGEEWGVAESWVFVEIENGDGRTATLRRKVAGAEGQDRKVVDVWEAAVLDGNGIEQGSTPYFARDPGSAQRDHGITSWLAQFIGWKLPEVVKHDGTLCPLYIECLLSLFFIEQSQGWTTIQAVTPRVFGIRQVEKKAVEFLLALDACGADTKRQSVEQQEESLRREWVARTVKLEGLARSLSGALRDFPVEPQAALPTTPKPFIEVFQDGSATPLSTALVTDRDTLDRLENVDIPSADEAASQLAEQLDEAINSLQEAETLGASLEEDEEFERANLTALETRLQTVEEDLAHNKDTRKLRDMGATRPLALARGECPTCHQRVDDTLLSQEMEHNVMGLDENIAYLNSQKQTLEKMRDRTAGAIAAIDRRRRAVTSYSGELRGKIRSLRKTLVSAGTAPSEAAVRERLVVEERLRSRVIALEEFEATMPDFSGLAARWRDLQAQKKELKSDEQSARDRERLNILSEDFTSALQEFGFESFPLDTVILDRTSYKPKREGFDLAYAVSASDHIRIIAAYATALLESARRFTSNHPGLLILDEPRQQNMQWPDFAKILSRLSAATAAKQQVIVATSDRPDAINALMKEIPHSRVDVDYDGWLLKPLRS